MFFLTKTYLNTKFELTNTIKVQIRVGLILFQNLYFKNANSIFSKIHKLNAYTTEYLNYSINIEMILAFKLASIT